MDSLALRRATPEDAVALRDLERRANLAALGHVFAPERHPFPDDDVLARWVLVLGSPDVTVLVGEDPEGLTVLAAYDGSSLRHLAVRPDLWGTGLATRAVGTVLEDLRRRGAAEVSLWCLEENHRARGLYERLGWRATADREDAPWPPHPVQLRYTRDTRDTRDTDHAGPTVRTSPRARRAR